MTIKTQITILPPRSFLYVGKAGLSKFILIKVGNIYYAKGKLIILISEYKAIHVSF